MQAASAKLRIQFQSV